MIVSGAVLAVIYASYSSWCLFITQLLIIRFAPFNFRGSWTGVDIFRQVAEWLQECSGARVAMDNGCPLSVADLCFFLLFERKITLHHTIL